MSNKRFQFPEPHSADAEQAIRISQFVRSFVAAGVTPFSHVAACTGVTLALSHLLLADEKPLEAIDEAIAFLENIKVKKERKTNVKKATPHHRPAEARDVTADVNYELAKQHECESCGALPGQLCFTMSGAKRSKTAHAVRLKAAGILALVIALLVGCGDNASERTPYCFELGCELGEACDAECDPTPTCAELGCEFSLCGGPQSPDDPPRECRCNVDGEFLVCVIPYPEAP